MTSTLRHLFISAAFGIAPAALLVPPVSVSTAHVTYDPARVTPTRMVEKITDMGYRARVEGSR